MYTLLLFGSNDELSEIQDAFLGSLSCKIISSSSSLEFYSIAFSRVYDLWLIDFNHLPKAEISLKEMLTSQIPKNIFIVNMEERQKETYGFLADYPKIQCFTPETSSNQIPKAFKQVMQDQLAKYKEKYLAGYINSPPDLSSILTKSPLMEKLLDLIKDIAPTDTAILLHGETGTGKELLAQIFHQESRRKSGPFMAVNCGALPDTLLESELFGHEKGAFTGAHEKRKGKIEHASGGTLFLDEIESMSEAMQVRLLRVLQEKSFQRLGGNIEISTDFRVIAATNTPPLELITSNRLRSDLYYRLSVFEVNVPPLRERIEDIPLLTRHFISKKKRGGREYVQGLDQQAMKILLHAPWFGNIRELQNVIERAVMLADSSVITADQINIPSLPLPQSPQSADDLTDQAFRPGTTLKSYKSILSQTAERKYLVELLDYTQGRIGESAELAGLTPRALYNKMKIYGLKKEDYKKTGNYFSDRKKE